MSSSGSGSVPGLGFGHSTTSIIISSLFALSSAFLAELINKVVPDPYLDEIFHVPQAQAYCRSDFKSWDPKLTTPPGLYLFSIAIHKVLNSKLFSFFTTKGTWDCQSIGFLRTTNLLMLMILPHLIGALLDCLEEEKESERERDRLDQTDPPSYSKSMNSTDAANPNRILSTSKTFKAVQTSSSKPMSSTQHFKKSILSKGFKTSTQILRRTLKSHLMVFLPPLYFFGYLYYTDVGSLTMVLASMLVAKKERHWVASLLGGVSLFFRQTNIIWLAFILATSILTKLKSREFEQKLGDPDDRLLDPILYSPYRRDGPEEQTQSQSQEPSSFLPHHRTPLFAQLLNILLSLFFLLKKPPHLLLVSKIILPYLPTFFSFIYFLKWNGGIVLGDKTNHQPTVHFPQIFYFLSFSTFFGFLGLIKSLGLFPPFSSQKDGSRNFSRSLKKLKPRFDFIAFISTYFLLQTILLVVHHQTHIHPFLLADNRHYLFYVFRRTILLHPYIRYLLAPIYMLQIRAWWVALGKNNSLLWLIGFWGCAMITLVPAGLVEPRYFLIPWMIMRLHLGEGEDWSSQEKEVKAENKTEEKDEAIKTVQDELASKNSKSGLEDLDLTHLVLEFLWYGSINLVTIYVFLYKPFKWESEEGWQRFMW